MPGVPFQLVLLAGDGGQPVAGGGHQERQPDAHGFLRYDLPGQLFPPVAVAGGEDRGAPGIHGPVELQQVFPYAFCFHFRNGGQYGKEQFTVSFACIQPLFHKVNAHMAGRQLPDTFQTVHGVAGEAADGFGQDVIHFSSGCVPQHLLEGMAAGNLGAGFGVVTVNTGQLPIWTGLDERCKKDRLLSLEHSRVNRYL